MADFENLRIEVHFDDGGDETNVLIVGDSASVVDFRDEVVEGLVGNDGLLVEVHHELQLRCFEI